MAGLRSQIATSRNRSPVSCAPIKDTKQAKPDTNKEKTRTTNMSTEKKILGQTQRTERIPLGGEQRFETRTMTSNTGATTKLPASGFVQSTTLPTQTTTTRVIEKPILENVIERTFTEKRSMQNIKEIHEQPIYEIHEKPVIENITQAAEVKRFGGQLQHEEIREDQGFALPAKSTTVHRTKEEYVSQVNEAPKISVQTQKQLNIIEQPLITEVITKPVVEISETNIERVIHERPIVSVVREQATSQTLDAPTMDLSGVTYTTTTSTLPGQTMNVTTTDTLVQETTSGHHSKKKHLK